MFCKNCGKKIEDDSLFCPHCGTAVKSGNAGTDSQNETLYDQVIEYDAPEETVVLSESNKPRFHKIQGPEGHESPNYRGHHSSSQVNYNTQGNYNTQSHHQEGYTAVNPQQNSGYSAQNSYGASNNAGAQNSYGASNNAGAQNSYGASNNADAQNSYGASNSAGVQNSYGTANNAGGQSSYGWQGNSNQQNDHTQGAYNVQGNYNAQGNNTQGNYASQGAYNTQGTYASQGTYNNAQGSFTPQGGYNAQGNNYNTQGSYNVQGAYSQGAAVQMPQKPKKKMGKGAIIGICIGSVAVVAAIIAVCLFFFFRSPGNSSYEQPLQAFTAAVNKGDLGAILDTVPLEAAIEEGTYSDYMMGMDYGDIIDMFESQFQEAFLTQIEDEYGADFHLECRIYGEETLSPSEIAELNSDYASYFGTPSDFIEEAVLVECDMVISAGDELESEDADINVVKVNGRWYIDLLSMY